MAAAGLDIGNHIEITSDGGYLIAASSSSIQWRYYRQSRYRWIH
ncbi:MAG: hypothetical protein WDO71_09765 [Bacteroidota bacterium]